MDQVNGKIRLGILGFPASFLSDSGLPKMDRGSQQALRALYHCGEDSLQEEEISGAADRSKLRGVNTGPSSAACPLHTHLYRYDLHPQIHLAKVIRHVYSYIKVPSGNNGCVCGCASTHPDVCARLYLILCIIKISRSWYVIPQS